MFLGWSRKDEPSPREPGTTCEPETNKSLHANHHTVCAANAVPAVLAVRAMKAERAVHAVQAVHAMKTEPAVHTIQTVHTILRQGMAS